MPIEIRELHIKAVIDSGGGNKSGGSKSVSAGSPEASSTEDPQQIIDLCVEKVMEIIKEKKER